MELSMRVPGERKLLGGIPGAPIEKIFRGLTACGALPWYTCHAETASTTPRGSDRTARSSLLALRPVCPLRPYAWSSMLASLSPPTHTQCQGVAGKSIFLLAPLSKGAADQVALLLDAAIPLQGIQIQHAQGYHKPQPSES